MNTLKTVLLLAAVLLCGQVAAQTTLYVDDTGPSCPTPADPNTVFGAGTQGDPYCFIGHAVEGKPPEFLSNWRFLLIGFRWWLRKVSGRQ